MFGFRSSRTLWLTALTMLAFAEVLHFGTHLNAFPLAAHVHHDHDHDHDHGHDHAHSSQPSEPSDAPGEHSHLTDHSHSPAIVDVQPIVERFAAVEVGVTTTSTAPEGPVGEIEYPPQLS